MLKLPSIVIELLNAFAPVFYGATTWEKAKILMIGAIFLSPVNGRDRCFAGHGLERGGQNFTISQVLNRAVWSSLAVSRVLLGLIVKIFVREGEPLVVGLDDTIERRWGEKIAARGI